tara:strand:+ start:427 stop:579 length:153 start_codon:yes stop_codon:yes gene_type:complete
MDKIKFAIEINKETYLIELLLLSGFINNKKNEPINGSKIMEDIKGKFISL